MEKKEKEHIKICGISIWRILAYFVVYSVAGFIIETIFGLLTKGVLESRKSFLYGPFCSIKVNTFVCFRTDKNTRKITIHYSLQDFL